jgi:hypothetical protein
VTSDHTKRDTHIAADVDQLPDLSAEIASCSRGAMQRRIAELEAKVRAAKELLREDLTYEEDTDIKSATDGSFIRRVQEFLRLP